VASLISKRIHGLPAGNAFVYANKGNLATIGRSAAVAQFGALGLSGLLAWLLWLGVHLCFLVGFRNRYLVLCQWVWHYFTYHGGARLITGPSDAKVAWPTQPRRLARPGRGSDGAPVPII
jgi:NADH dehydrogenase